MMENTTQYTGLFECVIQDEEAHIRQKTFNVTIPSLFPEVANKFETTTNSVPLTPDRSLNQKNKVSGNLETKTNIVAKNFTDYHHRLKGDTMKEEMEYTDGITEPEAFAEGSYNDFKSHQHTIKAPITLYNYIYKELNNVKVAKGTKAYGFFLNGTYDVNSFVIIRIEGAVPLQADDLINYVK